MSPSPEAFFPVLAQTCTEVRRAFDRHVGTSQVRRQVLALLADRGEVSQATLGRELGIDGAAVTRLVKGLEAQGAVHRRLDPDDNRFTLASLTAAGEDLAAGLRSAHDRYQAWLLAGVDPDDLAAARRVLDQVQHKLRQAAHEDAPPSPE